MQPMSEVSGRNIRKPSVTASQGTGTPSENHSVERKGVEEGKLVTGDTHTYTRSLPVPRSVVLMSTNATSGNTSVGEHVVVSVRLSWRGVAVAHGPRSSDGEVLNPWAL